MGNTTLHFAWHLTVYLEILRILKTYWKLHKSVLEVTTILTASQETESQATLTAPSNILYGLYVNSQCMHRIFLSPLLSSLSFPPHLLSFSLLFPPTHNFLDLLVLWHGTNTFRVGLREGLLLCETMFKIEAGILYCGMLGGHSHFLHQELKACLKKKKLKRFLSLN